MNDCKHLRIVGDNYGETCLDCGKQIKGYGYGGWFGRNITTPRECIHLWLDCGDDTFQVCPFCEETRYKEQEQRWNPAKSTI